ncbi:MAG: hypothetical protein U0R67_00740 [Micropruina glycogenica]
MLLAPCCSTTGCAATGDSPAPAPAALHVTLFPGTRDLEDDDLTGPSWRRLALGITIDDVRLN